jgi:hypothetical protein
MVRLPDRNLARQGISQAESVTQSPSVASRLRRVSLAAFFRGPAQRRTGRPS